MFSITSSTIPKQSPRKAITQYAAADTALCYLHEQRPVVTAERKNTTFYSVFNGKEHEYYFSYTEASDQYDTLINLATKAFDLAVIQDHSLSKDLTLPALYNEALELHVQTLQNYGVQKHHETVSIYEISYMDHERTQQTTLEVDPLATEQLIEKAYYYLHVYENSIFAERFGYRNMYTAFQQPYLRKLFSVYSPTFLQEFETTEYMHIINPMLQYSQRTIANITILGNYHHVFDQDESKDMFETYKLETRQLFTKLLYKDFIQNVDDFDYPFEWLFEPYRPNADDILQQLYTHIDNYEHKFQKPSKSKQQERTTS